MSELLCGSFRIDGYETGIALWPIKATNFSSGKPRLARSAQVRRTGRAVPLSYSAGSPRQRLSAPGRVVREARRELSSCCDYPARLRGTKGLSFPLYGWRSNRSTRDTRTTVPARPAPSNSCSRCLAVALGSSGPPGTPQRRRAVSACCGKGVDERRLPRIAKGAVPTLLNVGGTTPVPGPVGERLEQRDLVSDLIADDRQHLVQEVRHQPSVPTLGRKSRR